MFLVALLAACLLPGLWPWAAAVWLGAFYAAIPERCRHDWQPAGLTLFRCVNCGRWR